MLWFIICYWSPLNEQLDFHLHFLQLWRSSFCKRALECNGHWSPFPFSVCTKCRIHSYTAVFDRRHSVIEKVLLWLVCSLLNCRINANGFSDIFCIRLHPRGTPWGDCCQELGHLHWDLQPYSLWDHLCPRQQVIVLEVVSVLLLIQI